MALDGLTPAVVFPLFNFLLRSVQTAYEVAAVPAETSDYLKTISQVLADIKIAKELRKECLPNLSSNSLTVVENVIRNTENAMAGVEVLVERARVDMSVNFGSVSPLSRVMWVVRDSTKINAAMTRLSIASQSLHREITNMQSIRAIYQRSALYSTTNFLVEDDEDVPQNQPHDPPPSYLQATIDDMHRRRSIVERRNSRARSQAALSRGNSVASETLSPYGGYYAPSAQPSSQHLGDTPSATLTNIARYIQENETILTAVSPAASAQPRVNLIPTRLLGTETDPAELAAPLPTIAPSVASTAKRASPLRKQIPPAALTARKTLSSTPLLANTPETGLSSDTSAIPKNLRAPRGFGYQTRTPVENSPPPRRFSYQPPMPVGPPPPPPSSTKFQESSLTMIPGLRKPMALSYADTEPDINGDSNTIQAIDIHDASAGSSGSEDDYSEIESSEEEEEETPAVEPVGARRRPAQIQHNPRHGTGRPMTIRNGSTRSRNAPLSRSEWQVQQQLAEEQNVEARGKYF